MRPPPLPVEDNMGAKPSPPWSTGKASVARSSFAGYHCSSRSVGPFEDRLLVLSFSSSLHPLCFWLLRPVLLCAQTLADQCFWLA